MPGIKSIRHGIELGPYKGTFAFFAELWFDRMFKRTKFTVNAVVWTRLDGGHAIQLLNRERKIEGTRLFCPEHLHLWEYHWKGFDELPDPLRDLWKDWHSESAHFEHQGYKMTPTGWEPLATTQGGM